MTVRDKYIGIVCLALSIFCFVLGLTLPVLSSKTSILGLTLRSESIYLTDTIQYFWLEGDWFMACLIGVTTLLFPALKYIIISNSLFHFKKVNDRMNKIFSQLDKWSMIEVFILALIVIGIKSGTNFVSVTMKSGAYFLAASVIIRMVLTTYIANRHQTISLINGTFQE